MSRTAGIVDFAQSGGERAALVRAGRAGAGWSFLGAGAQYLRVGRDDEVRLLCAGTLAGLGLPALAALAAERVEDPALAGERDALIAGGVGAGPMDVDAMVACARANFGAAGLDGERAIEAWRARGDEYFGAKDGNVVRRSRGGDDLPAWDWLADMRGMASEFCRQHLAEGAIKPLGPVTVEGVSPPWLLLAIHGALPRLGDGYWPLLHIVERDVAGLGEGFALADLSAVLGRGRVFAGDGAGEILREFVRGRFEYPATGAVVPKGGAGPRVEPDIGEIVRALSREQKAEAARLHRELLRRDRGRDAAYWSARLGEARPGRVLIPTCRYSTFTQHASRDLAEAFESLGWEARVLIEPDDHSRLSTIAYHRAQLELDPDLVVLINYPRAARAQALPTETPFVCWVQDAMPHLFDGCMGRGHGPRDFIFGHVYSKLFREFGYPAERAASMPVVASERKFHAGPVSAERAERCACVMAYVSHQSETPTAMHARMCAETGEPAIVSVLHEMRRLLGERYGKIVGECGHRLAKSIPADAWARVHGVPPPPLVAGQLADQYLVPILERVVRHEMLEWAAQIADRRGWSLKIYGKGWEEHATLGRFAAGPLEHGEDLRAAYQGATVHLHGSMTTLVHQRVMECALSGGLALCRLIAPNLGASRQAALFELVKAGVEPDEVAADGTLWYRTERHGPLRRFGGVVEAAGMNPPERVSLHPGTARSMSQYPCAFGDAAVEDLVDVGTGCFRSAAGLESLVHRLIQRPETRREQSEAIARRVCKRFTHDVVARGMISLVRGVVCSPGGVPVGGGPGCVPDFR